MPTAAPPTRSEGEDDELKTQVAFERLATRVSLSTNLFSHQKHSQNAFHGLEITQTRGLYRSAQNPTERLPPVRLYHATTEANLDSIRQHGLTPEYSQGKLKVNWLHTASRRHWAIAHVQKRHGCNLDDVIILEIQIPRGRLTRRWRGLWTTTETLTDFTTTDAEALAASPITNHDTEV